MSRSFFNSRAQRVVDWSPDLTLGYVGAEPPGQAACNSMLAEVVALADRIVAGTDLMNAARTEYLVQQLNPIEDVNGSHEPLPAFGRYISDADLRSTTSDRVTMALALAQVAREIHAGTGRQAGVIQLTPVLLASGVAAVLLVGIAVGWYAAGGSTASQADRVRHAGIAEAGRLQSERVRIAAETGQPIAPPGPIETAAAEDIRTAAARAREAGIGQDIEQAVGGLVKGTMILGGAFLAYKLLGSKG